MITIEQARFDLRDTGAIPTLTDPEVQALIDRAAGIVSDFLKREPFAVGEVLTSPVESAIRMVVVNLFEDPRGEGDPLSRGVRSLLQRSRDPAFA